MRVTAEVKAATEKAIRAAARRLFIRRGFEATSTRQIATAAQVATGTVFNYFPSKEALAASLVAEALATGRPPPAAGDTASLTEDLFSLVARDIRALEPIRSFVGVVLETGLSPLVAHNGDAAAIRTERLRAAHEALSRHGLGAAASTAVMHLYWSLYVGVLSFWAADRSPHQEDTWSVLDHGVRMFVGGLDGVPRTAPGPDSQGASGVGVRDAEEVEP